MTDYRDHLSFATETAFQAGRLALSYFQRPIEVFRKDDDSPVTAADRSAEQLMRERIVSHYPDHNIVGEELGESFGAEDSTYRWILDPIDGTRSFIHGVPLWGVLVGLEVDAEMVVGVCYLPGLDEMYAAAKGAGCYLNGRACRVSETDDLAEALVSVTDVRDLDSRHPEFWRRLRKSSGTLRGYGDCYGHCLVAAGRIDAMLDPIMNVWDNAALKPIVEEAGGRFTDWAGNPSIYGASAISVSPRLEPQLRALIDS